MCVCVCARVMWEYENVKNVRHLAKNIGYLSIHKQIKDVSEHGLTK